MQVPSGIITLWFGSLGSIPTGWVLCDGNNGTPDLRNRFLIGAGDTFNPDDTGGSANHTHPFTGDGHTHTFLGGSGIQPGGSFQPTTSSDAATGTTDAADNNPPFHALAYIMKT